MRKEIKKKMTKKSESKKKYYLKYGKGEISFYLNPENVICELSAEKLSNAVNGKEEIIRALENPVGTKMLDKLLSPEDNVCIVTSDITRPCPTHLMLPPILDILNNSGIPYENITVVFGLGSHRKHTRQEMEKLVGEENYKLINVEDSDTGDMVCMGTTSRGTPVNITRSVANADIRICLGNIEMHYFAGYSGGSKAIMPGVSDRHAIQANHSKMTEETSKCGEIKSNNVRLDIEEAADICGIDFILNVILDEDKNILKAVAGDRILAHRQGCEFLDSIYKIKIPKLADIVIASAGGYPKDINIYQAQKALDNAKHAVKEGGIIILAADCVEGFGEDIFEQWLLNAHNPNDLINRIKKEFILGGHKAAAIAMVLKNSDVYLVSSLKKEISEKTFMKHFDSVELAIKKAIEKTNQEPKIIIMPQAGSTLPIL